MGVRCRARSCQVRDRSGEGGGFLFGWGNLGERTNDAVRVRWNIGSEGGMVWKPLLEIIRGRERGGGSFTA